MHLQILLSTSLIDTFLHQSFPSLLPLPPKYAQHTAFNPVPVPRSTPKTVRDLLLRNNLVQYAEMLVSNGYDDLRFMHETTEAELWDVGITSVQDREKACLLHPRTHTHPLARTHTPNCLHPHSPTGMHPHSPTCMHPHIPTHTHAQWDVSASMYIFRSCTNMHTMYICALALYCSVVYTYMHTYSCMLKYCTVQVTYVRTLCVMLTVKCGTELAQLCVVLTMPHIERSRTPPHTVCARTTLLSHPPYQSCISYAQVHHALLLCSLCGFSSFTVPFSTRVPCP